MLDTETKTRIHEAIESLSRDEVVEQVAASMHGATAPESLADYLISMGQEEAGNPY